MARQLPLIPQRQRCAPTTTTTTTTTKTAAKIPRGTSQLSTKMTMILWGASATAREGAYCARSIVLLRSVAEFPPPRGDVRQAAVERRDGIVPIGTDAARYGHQL